MSVIYNNYCFYFTRPSFQIFYILNLHSLPKDPPIASAVGKELFIPFYNKHYLTCHKLILYRFREPKKNLQNNKMLIVLSN